MLRRALLSADNPPRLRQSALSNGMLTDRPMTMHEHEQRFKRRVGILTICVGAAILTILVVTLPVRAAHIQSNETSGLTCSVRARDTEKHGLLL